MHRLDDLKQMRQMERNRCESVNAAVIEGIQTHLQLLDRQIQAVEQALADHIDRDPDLRNRHDLLTSIPGIADTTSAHLLARLGDLGRYHDVGQIVAHAGLNPAQRQSGTFQGKARISRIGDATLRTKLYMPALVAKRHNPVLAAFARRLAERGKPPKVILCAVMRKLLHVIWGVLRSGRPFDPSFAVA